MLHYNCSRTHDNQPQLEFNCLLQLDAYKNNYSSEGSLTIQFKYDFIILTKNMFKTDMNNHCLPKHLIVPKDNNKAYSFHYKKQKEKSYWTFPSLSAWKIETVLHPMEYVSHNMG